MILTKENFDTSPIGDWKCIPDNIFIIWENKNIDTIVYATPSWSKEDETPVEISNNIVDERKMILVHKNGTIEEKNEYVRLSLKILFKYLEKQ